MENRSRKQIAIIGAGPAGMMAAIAAAEEGAEVLLLERNERIGRKLCITGKGRCNVTNAAPIRDFFAQVISNPRFLYSAFNGFTNEDLMRFFEAEGVPLKNERGGRVFPVSDQARDISDALGRTLKRKGVRLKTGVRVTELAREDDRWRVTAGEQSWTCDAVILACGGKSYPGTGSTGDGYRLAQQQGHTIVPLRAGLNGLCCEENWAKTLSGLSLKNVQATVTASGEKKPVYSEFGEMLFTHFGVSGPLILSASSQLEAFLLKKEKTWAEGFTLHLDLKPALSMEQLDARLLRDLEKQNARSMQHALSELLPQRLIAPVLLQAHIALGKKASEISKKERSALGAVLKDLTLHLNGSRPISEALVTMGGVSVREVDPRTCASRVAPELYFAGELLDVDALTGGYNLQIAFSTGRLAGKSAAADHSGPASAAAEKNQNK